MLLRILGILFIFIFPLGLTAQNDPTVWPPVYQDPNEDPPNLPPTIISCVTSEPVRMRNQIVAKFETEDMSRKIEEMRNELERCNFKPGDYGFGSGIFDFWLRRTRELSFERAKARLDSASQTGYELAPVLEYKKYAELVGQPADQTKAALKYYSDIGQAEQKKNRERCGGGKTTDFSEKFGPIRDQKDIGWCYAFVAADLLSFKTGQRISAADVGYSYYNEFWNNLGKMLGGGLASEDEGGFAKWACIKALEHGLCLEENAKSEDGGKATLLDALRSLESLKRQSVNPDCEDEECAPNCAEMNAGIYFPGLKIQDLADVVRAASKEVLFAALADKACEPRIRPSPPPEPVDVFSDDPRVVFENLDAQLDKDEPAALSFNSKILKDPETKEVGRHASVVAGRRYNDLTGQCEYLIRNSWGPECNYHYEFECHGGNIWVPKNVLWKNVRGLTWLK